MLQKERQLLLQDLCARLPYGVKCQIEGFGENFFTLKNINIDHENGHLLTFEEKINNLPVEVYISEVKPCLFPLSSITEEQSIELFHLFGINLSDSVCTDYIKINECTGITFFLDKGFDVEIHLDKLIGWLNKNHFDYRGLIPMGLAINATNLKIYENKTITKS